MRKRNVPICRRALKTKLLSRREFKRTNEWLLENARECKAAQYAARRR